MYSYALDLDDLTISNEYQFLSLRSLRNPKRYKYSNDDLFTTSKHDSVIQGNNLEQSFPFRKNVSSGVADTSYSPT